jgi:hypothetical protein
VRPGRHVADTSGFARYAAALDSSVATAATGDRVAFARLVDAYDDDTMRVAFVVAGGDREVAEDAVQVPLSHPRGVAERG